MAKRDPKGNYGTPVTARLGEQFRTASMDIAKPAPHVHVVEEQQGSSRAAPVAPVQTPDSMAASNLALAVNNAKQEPAASPATAQTGSTTSIRIILDLAEREGLDSLLNGLTKKLGARVKLANLIRANIALLMEAQEPILGRAEKMSAQIGRRPANDDALALAQFEDQLKNILAAGLYDSTRRRY